MTATYAVNCSILFTELPLLERPQAARAAGFTAVEFWWPFESTTPPDADVTAFIRAHQEAGVHLSGLNFAAGDMPSGERGILSDPALSVAFRDSVDVAVGIAKILGTRKFNALYGNRVDGLSPAAQDDTAAENLSYASTAAAAVDATILLEPVSGAPHYPIRTASDAVHIIDNVCDGTGANNIRLLADLYHLYVNGDDVDQAIELYNSYIGHVQLADAPGRGEPGTGEVPLGDYLGLILAAGYRGHVGLEYKASQTDPFGWLPRAERGGDAVNTGSLRTTAETRQR